MAAPLTRDISGLAADAAKNVMEEIRLPVPKQPLPDSEPMEMDDYVRLVHMNYRLMKESTADIKMRKDEFVSTPFRIPA